MSHKITVESGTTAVLKTAGKYCDRDIEVTATGGGGGTAENLDAELAEQEALIDQLRDTLRGKAGGGGGEPMEMIATFADGTTKTYIIYGEAVE